MVQYVYYSKKVIPKQTAKNPASGIKFPNAGFFIFMAKEKKVKWNTIFKKLET